jgi:hypothetical protein
LFEDYDKKKIAILAVAVLLVIIVVSALVAPNFYAGLFSKISGSFKNNGTGNNGTNPITNPDKNQDVNAQDIDAGHPFVNLPGDNGLDSNVTPPAKPYVPPKDPYKDINAQDPDAGHPFVNRPGDNANDSNNSENLPPPRV